jgi:tetratricopeptide (TPR) repeat protein
MVLHAHEQLQLAVEAYARAAALDAASFEWVYLAGTAWHRLGEHREASRLLRRAVELRRDYPAARLRLAEALVAAGELDESAALYEGLKKDPQFESLAWYGLGRIAAARGNLTVAVAHLQQARRLFGEFGAALYALARAHRGLGQREEAAAVLAAAEKHRLDTPPVDDPVLDSVRNLVDAPGERVRRARQLEDEGRVGDAIAELEHALTIHAGLIQARVNLISLYGRSGDVARAEQHYRAGLAVGANVPELHYNYGVLLMTAGRHDDAVSAFQKALALNPNDAKIHNNLGQLLERKSGSGVALEHYQQAVHHDPANAVARFNLGRMLVALGRPLDAAEQFELLLVPESDDTPRYTFALAAAYARAGRREDALRYGTAALQLARRKGQAELAASIERDLERLSRDGP